MSDFRLKVFQSVAKNLSFTKASQELFVSQPAITKHIQELESTYQARLFDRQGSKISLTEAGKLLLEHCGRILEDYKRLEYEMHLLHNEYTGELRLGASTTIAQYVLPPLLASFIKKFPQVNLSLMNGNSREIEAALQEHRIDLGLVEGVFRLPNLKYTTFLEDELVAVTRTGSKLQVGEEITPEELLHIPLVLRERGSGTLDVFEKALQQHNIKLSSLGAYTGEVSAAMVASTGAKYVILGHSERRAYYGETVAILEEKVKLALANGLTPIFCIGEVLEEREANKQNEVVAAQLASVFSLSAEDFSKIILAYEPVWAIGTGKTASAEQAQEIHAFIRSLIVEKYGKEIADNCSILYGGSCKPSNAKELFANPDVDGGLIGGAALKVSDFKGIIDAFN